GVVHRCGRQRLCLVLLGLLGRSLGPLLGLPRLLLGTLGFRSGPLDALSSLTLGLLSTLSGSLDPALCGLVGSLLGLFCGRRGGGHPVVGLLRSTLCILGALLQLTEPALVL